MNFDGHNIPCYLADGFYKPTTRTPFTLVLSSHDICLIFTLQDFFGRMTKIEDRYWIETDSFVHSLRPTKPNLVSKEHHTLMYMLHTHKISIILVFYALKSFQMLK